MFSNSSDNPSKNKDADKKNQNKGIGVLVLMTPEQKVVYRGDARSPSTIFESGFKAKGSDLNLNNYITHFPKMTSSPEECGYIATSTSAEVAQKFPHKKGLSNLYVIDYPKNGISIIDFLNKKRKISTIDTPPGFKLIYTIAKNEKEIAVPSEIQAQNIQGAYQVKLKGLLETKAEVSETFIANKNYVPSSDYIWAKRLSFAGKFFTTIGVTADGLNLYVALDASITQKNPDIFAKKVMEVIGGWSGATLGGRAGQVALTALKFTPHPIAKFTTILTSSALGYKSGSEITSKIFDKFSNDADTDYRKIIYQAFSEYSNDIDTPNKITFPKQKIATKSILAKTRELPKMTIENSLKKVNKHASPKSKSYTQNVETLGAQENKVQLKINDFLSITTPSIIIDQYRLIPKQTIFGMSSFATANNIDNSARRAQAVSFHHTASSVDSTTSEFGNNQASRKYTDNNLFLWNQGSELSSNTFNDQDKILNGIYETKYSIENLKITGTLPDQEILFYTRGLYISSKLEEQKQKYVEQRQKEFEAKVRKSEKYQQYADLANSITNILSATGHHKEAKYISLASNMAQATATGVMNPVLGVAKGIESLVIFFMKHPDQFANMNKQLNDISKQLSELSRDFYQFRYDIFEFLNIDVVARGEQVNLIISITKTGQAFLKYLHELGLEYDELHLRSEDSKLYIHAMQYGDAIPLNSFSTEVIKHLADYENFFKNRVQSSSYSGNNLCNKLPKNGFIGEVINDLENRVLDDTTRGKLLGYFLCHERKNGLANDVTKIVNPYEYNVHIPAVINLRKTDVSIVCYDKDLKKLSELITYGNNTLNYLHRVNEIYNQPQEISKEFELIRSKIKQIISLFDYPSVAHELMKEHPVPENLQELFNSFQQSNLEILPAQKKLAAVGLGKFVIYGGGITHECKHLAAYAPDGRLISKHRCFDQRQSGKVDFHYLNADGSTQESGHQVLSIYATGRKGNLQQDLGSSHNIDSSRQYANNRLLTERSKYAKERLEAIENTFLPLVNAVLEQFFLLKVQLGIFGYSGTAFQQLKLSLPNELNTIKTPYVLDTAHSNAFKPFPDGKNVTDQFENFLENLQIMENLVLSTINHIRSSEEAGLSRSLLKLTELQQELLRTAPDDSICPTDTKYTKYNSKFFPGVMAQSLEHPNYYTNSHAENENTAAVIVGVALTSQLIGKISTYTQPSRNPQTAQYAVNLILLLLLGKWSVAATFWVISKIFQKTKMSIDATITYTNNLNSTKI